MCIVEPVGMILIGFVPALWWKLDDSPQIGLAKGIFGLLILYALCYETGYKKSLLRLGMHRYFYIVFLAPAVVATIGFLYGLFRFYIHSSV